MSFRYPYTVRFRDTDAAGVVYFARVLALCHEAYEAALADTGVDLKAFFSGAEVAIPIVHASVDFFRPMHCGDRLEIHLTPTRLSDSEFAIAYEIFPLEAGERCSSRATTRHVCIDPLTRQRDPLPALLVHWLNRWGD